MAAPVDKAEKYNELYELEKSQARGIWGNSQPLFNGLAASTNNNPLVWIDLPPWMARGWTVTLLAMRYQTGTLSTFGGFSPDQQAVPTTFGINQAVQVQLDYGISNASERNVLIDYPWAGGSFELTCASMQVKMAPYPNNGLAVSPTVGAFISPSVRGGGQLKNPPTFTVSVNIAALGTADIPVPARARAYSLVASNANGITNNVVATQQTTPAAVATSTRIDSIGGNTLGGIAYEYYTGAVIANQVIHPLTTNIHIQNLTAALVAALVVRFELDLG
jgi:hypothetical protein